MEGIPVLVAVIWLVNFGISFWNARVVGQIWVEAKQVGGLANFLKWCGAIMAFCGFFWCYVIIEAFIGHAVAPDVVTPYVMNGAFSLGYLIIIFPVLGTGFAIWASSLYEAWKTRTLGSMGRAAWNTFAQAHNTYEAFRGVPSAWNAVKDVFGSSKSSSDDNKNAGAAIVVLLIVALAFILAFATTAGIIRHYAATKPLPANPHAKGT
jgi:hypothetical protein